MRVANNQHLEQPWRIHALVTDFKLEDVWELRHVRGTAGEFDDLLALVTRFDPSSTGSAPTQFLWATRDRLGSVFKLGSISSAPRGSALLCGSEKELIGRLEEDLVGTADSHRFDHLPFRPLYRTENEFAAHLANATVHGVMHLAWVGEGDAKHPQMAVYVKPNGWFGRAYMALIKPFRYLIVYPAIERQITQAWSRRRPGPPTSPEESK